MPAPGDGSRSSRELAGRRPRHYLAVELAGSGEQVNVNDVVQLTSSESGASVSLAQVRYALSQVAVGFPCALPKGFEYAQRRPRP